MDSVTVAIGKLFGDGAYEGNEIFMYLADNRILPCIKVRKNARVGLKKGNILRNLSVIFQKNDLKRWKDSILSYGQRWIVETLFSSIKRMFGEYIYSVRLKNMIHEIMLKASLYNKMIIYLDKTDSKIMDFNNHATKHLENISLLPLEFF